MCDYFRTQTLCQSISLWTQGERGMESSGPLKKTPRRREHGASARQRRDRNVPTEQTRHFQQAARVDGIRARTRSAGRLPAGLRDRVARRLAAGQREDGGWAGRAGGSDLYYTSFALRLADALDLEDARLWQGAAGFLRSGVNMAGVADVLNLIESWEILDRRLSKPAAGGQGVVRVEDALSPFRRRDGFALRPGGPLSCYATFMAWRACMAAAAPAPWLEEAATAVAATQRPDGGFAEAEAESSGASSTAAALCLFCAAGSGHGAERRAAAFLASLRRADGGFAANALAHNGDLLSTFTALVALSFWAESHVARLGDAARFVRGLSRDGGWLSCASDTGTDVEYAYYGFASLCVLASLAEARTSSRMDCG